MSEENILRRLRSTHQTQQASVIRGIGDDCAVLRPDARQDLVFTTDFSIEDRHFTLAQPASTIGHRALARSLSDLAAMGSEPVFCLVSLAMPQRLSGRWANTFYRGLLRLAGQHGMTLAGGDLSQSEKVIIDVMCCGRVPRGRALLRSGAKPGDAIYVTGPLGKSWNRKLKPKVSEGITLRDIATACIDVSDGLALDLHRLCLQSGVAAEIDSIPLARGATLENALHGGEDYELLFTSAKRTSYHRLGRITDGTAGSLQWNGQPLEPKGWDHFA